MLGVLYASLLPPTPSARSAGERRRAVSSETDSIENGSGYVITVAWSWDSKVLASGGADSRIILWDAKKGERLTELNGHR